MEALEALARGRGVAGVGRAAAAAVRAALAPLATVLLTLSGYGLLAAQFWIAELATSVRPHLLVASLLILIAAVACRARPALLLALAAALVNALVMTWTAHRPTIVDAGTRVRVLSLNVRYGNRNPQPVVDLLRAVPADVVVLSEAAGRWRTRLRALRDLYPRSALDQVQGAGGTLILSRFPVQQVEIVAIPLGGGGGTWPTLAVDLRIGAERSVRVYAAHPMGPMQPNSWRMRNAYLAGLARRIAAEPGPVVLAGDLNTTPWSPAMLRLLSTAGLQDASGAGWPAPTWRPLPVRRLPWLGIPIDYVLTSKELGVTSFELLADVGSDHLPVLVAVVVPERAGG